ncbi:DNA primase [Dysgonomonas macrotermitis]|uniref:DNA primase n=1 Tax=Dysgonomonas macrotermitis TaxID=1346286 RepID=A0A1M5DA24_9BACT|nr:DNA primase [Dysgonomonas macrotermitis]SHF63818.1 DNA primase [Dysgonomonas macrotermitis]
MIDQITIDRIIEAARIEDVVGEFVTLKKRGVNLVGLCPFHTDKTPSFYVSASKNICKCFACGEGGSAVHFIMKHEQLSYFEALRYLAKKYNIEIQERELTEDQKNAYNERESLFILNDYARNYFVSTLHNHSEGKNIGLSYFKERGFRDDIIKKFQLGYSLEQRDAFTQDAQKNGFRKEYLIKTGLTIEGDNYLVDRFRGRVMFPVHTLSGKVVAFGGRILKKAENTGKYVNSPESDIYHKSDQLYGIYFAKQAITKADCCYLVEGYTDVISMHQAGIENVVASSGTALTPGQIKLIHRFTTNITVLYDGDAAGIKAALRGIDLLLEEGMNIKVVLLPDGEDPDSFARKQNAESLQNYIKEHEVDFIRFKTQLLLEDAGDDPIKRASLITDIVSSITIIPDGIIRSVYIRDCSNLLGIDERVLINEVNKKRQSYLEKEYEKRTVQTGNTPLPPEAQYEAAAVVASSVDLKPQAGINRQNTLDKYELSILYYIIRYGNLPMIQNDDETELTDEEKVNVLEYIKYDLERDGLWFQQPLYTEILDEAVTQMDDPNFVPSRYFLAHPRQEISKLAAHLLEDRYELGKIHTKQYGENVKREDTPLAEEKQLQTSVPLALLELKEAYISLKLKELMNQMNQRWKEGDSETATAILSEFQELKRIKDILAKALLEKVVLRF